MESLIEKSERKAKSTLGLKKRYLFEQIDWSQKLIVILGYRGSGKTTLMLQYLAAAKKKGVYASLDDLFFETNRLANTVAELYEKGIRLFLFDEVHRYQFWSKDLKQIYDDFDDIQIIVSGSSILDLSKGSEDLSRRASLYTLYGFSFREYLSFKKDIQLPVLSITDIVEKHHQLAPDLSELFRFRKDFQDYLEHGYYPFFAEGIGIYPQKLEETIHLVIDTDIAPFEDIQYSTARTMKKLLYVVSQSVPFTPNINKLAEKLQTPRNTILRLLDYLNSAQILSLLRSSAKGDSYLQKPEKIFLQNSNYIYLFAPSQANIGNVRETFFFNQLNVGHRVTSARYGDFLINNDYVFEIGGASKTREQIHGVPNAYLALDIETGSNERIPLWLFGLLY